MSERLTVTDQMLKCEAFFFDLDGCVYFGNEQALGAAQLIMELRNKGKQVRFITNNSTDSSRSIAAKLTRMGFDIEPRDILTATEYIGPYLLQCYGPLTIKVVGSQDLHLALEQAGHTLIPLYSGQKAQAVVIGRDISFSYDKLYAIVEELEQGAIAIITNPDLYHPGSRGEKIPETGALAASFEAMTGTQLACFGKPSPHLFLSAMKECGVEIAERCVMIGDNLYTDVAGGKAAGMRTIWLTNNPLDTLSVEPNYRRPDWTFHDLNEMLTGIRIYD